VPNFPRHFGTGAEVSIGHFGTSAKCKTFRHQTHSAEMSWVRSVLGPKCPYTFRKRVTVVKLGVYNGGGNCFLRCEGQGRDGYSGEHECDDLDNADIRSEKERCSSNMKPRLRADWVVSIEVEEL